MLKWSLTLIAAALLASPPVHGQFEFYGGHCDDAEVLGGLMSDPGVLFLTANCQLSNLTVVRPMIPLANCIAFKPQTNTLVCQIPGDMTLCTACSGPEFLTCNCNNVFIDGTLDMETCITFNQATGQFQCI